MPHVTDQLKVALADRYLIESELGAGGMATVYLAHDVKHNRKVALKVLKPELAAVIGADRFLKEIEVTANLQHPHILPLHDSGTVKEQGSATEFLYYVMPYIDGESLRDKLDREKQLGVEEAVEIARAVASALDYAHRHKVIHRDIKPENVLLHDGQATIADFGIALAVSHAGGSRLTETGLSIGTPHYMSPEQAMGDRELDARSDIYSLGAILYEMLAGEPPFTGPTAQAIVAKVITEPPPQITTSRPTVPPHVAAVIQKALEKLPADRFHSAADVADGLGNPTFTTPSFASVAAARPIPARPPAERRKWIAALALIVALTGAALVGWLRPTLAERVYRFHIVFPDEDVLVSLTNGRSIALSPDGTQLAYVASNGRLFVRRLDQLESREIAGTSNAQSPFFSPDGAWLGYFQTPNMMKVALAGGPPLRIAGAPGGRGAHWDDDDQIVYAPDNAGPILRVSAGGGTPDTLSLVTLGFSHRWPRLLPDGKGVLVTEWAGSVNDAYVGVLDLDSKEVTRLVNGTDARYVPTGHLVYGTADGTVLAVPFDIGRREVTGSPVALLEGVNVDISAGIDVAVADDGMLVYVSGSEAGQDLIAVDRQGVERILVENIPAANGPRVSPDGRYVVLGMTQDGNTDIRIYDLEQGTQNRRTFDGNNFYPVWSAQGDTIYFSSVRGGGDRDIYRRAADGSGSAELVLERPGQQWEYVAGRGGGPSVFRESAPSTGRDIWKLPADGGEATPYLVTPYNERGAILSPDGRWVAYMSDESGRDEVYVRAFPEPTGVWQMSTGGGSEPVWSTSGRELFYREGRRLVSVPLTLGSAPNAGQRTVLFEWSATVGEQHTNYDVHPATGEFVALRPAGDQTLAVIAIVNWFEELKERAEN